MFTIRVENARGDVLDFVQNPAYDVLKVDGLPPPSATLNFSQMANFDGARFNSAQLPARNLVFTIKIYEPVEKNRISLYKYFPLKKSVRIYYENDTRSVFIDGYVETCEPNLFTMNETAQVSIICPDPYWKEQTETVLNFSNVISLFEFPFSIEEEGIEFSRINHLTTAIFENGEVESGMTIEFIANANQILNPRFINRTTGEYIGLNVDMNEGDIIRINTRRGEKSIVLIRDGTQTNILNSRQSQSTFVQLVEGQNELSYECDHGAENLTVRVSAYRLFGGV